MNADEQAVRQLIQRWHEATAAGQVDAVLQLMDDDAVFLTAGGRPPLRGREAFAEQLKSVLVQQRIESSGEVQEVAVSGDLAYAWSLLRVRITPRAGGVPMERSGPALSVFRKQRDSRWQLLRDANLLPAPT